MSSSADLESWKLFFQIVQRGSITKVANELDVESSSVSRRLARLEKDLGCELFVRDGKKLSLSSAGSIAYTRMRRIVYEAEAAIQDFSAVDNCRPNFISIAAPLGITQMILPKLITEFVSIHQEYQFEIQGLGYQEIYRPENFDAYDFVFSAAPVMLQNLTTRLLGGFRHFIGATSAYLDQHDPVKTPNDLRHHPLVSFYAHDKKSCSILHRDEEVFPLTMTPAVAINNPGGIKTAVMCGKAVGLYLPNYVFQEELENGTVRPVLTDWEMPIQHLYINYKHKVRNPMAEEFLEYIIRAIQSEPTMIPPGGKGYWINNSVPVRSTL